MDYTDAVDVVLQECRFLVGRRTLDSLLPDAVSALAPLAYVEFLDTSRQRTMLGYPVLAGDRLRVELLQLLVQELGRCMADPNYMEDLNSIGVETFRGEAYVSVLTDRLVRAASHADSLRLDSVLWLTIARTCARILNHDTVLLERLKKASPRAVVRAEKQLLALLRLKASDPVRHAGIKRRVLRSAFARHDFAVSALSQSLGELYGNSLYREMVNNQLVFTESPDSLYSIFDLREVFGLGEFRIELDRYGNLQGLLQAVFERSYRRQASGKGSSAESYIVETFAVDELLEKAGRLDIVDLKGGGGGGSGDAFPAKVGWLLGLQPAAVHYLLRHLEHFDLHAAVSSSADLPKSFLKELKRPQNLALELASLMEVHRSLLTWDFFNTAGSFLREVELREGERLAYEGRALRSSTVALDLRRERELYSLRRHGTVVLIAIDGLSHEVDRALGEGARADSDFAALCIRKLLAVRRTLSLSPGRGDSFAGGVLLDVFPRALDGLRYVGVFQSSFEGSRLVCPRPWEESRANPFADGLRVALGTGDFAEISIPGGRKPGEGESEVHPVGAAVEKARGLAGSAEARVRAMEAQVYDPLEIFRVHVVDGALVNRGLASCEQTFREALASVKLEGLERWTPAEAGRKVVGRTIQLKNYRFELIFDDPVTSLVTLVRRVELPPGGEGAAACFEYVMMSQTAFGDFLDRVAETERHQPDLSRAGIPQLPDTSYEDSGWRRPAAAEQLGGFAAVAAASSPQQRPLNQPAAQDFQDPDFEGLPGLEHRLGLAGGLAAQPGEYLAADSSEDLQAAENLSFDGPSLSLDPSSSSLEGITDDSSSSWTASAEDSEGGDEFFGLQPGMLPEFGAAGAELDPEPQDEEVLSLEVGETPARHSLLGVLEDDMVQRLEALEQGLPLPQAETPELAAAAVEDPVESEEAGPDELALGEEAAASSRPAGRPDLPVLFGDYAWFAVGAPGEPGYEIAIGRCFGDVFFDLHRFTAPGEEESWGLREAIGEFLRAKIRANFVPQNLNHESLPEDSEEPSSLPLDLVESIYDTID